mmetsp:Transcript_32627/g.47728  ORF Transcript_32627/g.47728 Transcript_32627/m.47728 type:complete len:140 (+) Transcript_32627:127-546(+)
MYVPLKGRVLGADRGCEKGVGAVVICFGVIITITTTSCGCQEVFKRKRGCFIDVTIAEPPPQLGGAARTPNCSSLLSRSSHFCFLANFPTIIFILFSTRRLIRRTMVCFRFCTEVLSLFGNPFKLSFSEIKTQSEPTLL